MIPEKAKILRTAGILLITILILITILSLYISYTIIHPPRRPVTITPSHYLMDYETVTFESLDGLELSGWLIPNNRSSSLVIVCHGHGANKGDVLEAARSLHMNGYSSFLFDFRAHGESEGDFATLGWLEPNDLKGAIAYVKERLNPEKIGVIGFSMGGATAITTAGQTPEIHAVVADSAFADRFKLVSKASRLPPPLSYLMPVFAEIQGMNMRENLPKDHAGKISPNALFIIQGDQDHLVETQDAELLYNQANDPKELWLVPDTPHVQAYLTQGKEYERRILEFFDRYLNG
ncbi:MAG: alpha/beta fold hydrolase [Candidatus Aenigmarchaeota archaeon]|nr:alpha/beta fold hydrolase [Candidatus Aenigmarchaeota archaeon]NIP40870.1 alpha/beta fold hydrolase [Candidatus Aenigmarchaeota archaeon]NIQ17984.1 alpha/beta fold hydrolase [Candidatus Aenigmarchaeota archaeon]NIS73573.1 alpha/beta fold hydrolase [Candidatus Aenigmarchaeota archaeon]